MPERRLFKRYDKSSQFILAHMGKSYDARMIDYSLDGIGLATGLDVPVKKGDVLTISCSSPQMNTIGMVTWIYDMDSERRMGFKITGQLRGRVEDFKLSDTLIGFQFSDKSGILEVNHGEAEKKVYIKGGDIVFSYSNQKSDHLGEMLVREGRITRERLQEIMGEMEETDQRMGRILVEHGLMKPQEIWDYVRKQAEEIILSLFSLEEGLFHFEEMPALPTEELIMLKLSAASLIYYGSKRVGEKRILNEAPPPESFMTFSSDPQDLFQNLKIDRAGQQVLACLKKKATVGEIISESGMDKIEVLKTIYALMNARIIEVGQGDEPSHGLPEEEIHEMFGQKVDPQFVEMVEDMYGKYAKLGYYGVLGIDSKSSLSDIKRAYYKAAKRFHPDNHFLLQNDDIKRKLSMIFSYIYEAYSTLSDPLRKREYEKSANFKPSGSSPGRRKTEKTATQGDRAREKFKIGIALYRNERYEEAEHAFKQALFIDGSKAEYHYYHGIALLKLQRFSDAKVSIEKAIKIDPSQSKYFREIGRIYLKKNCPTRAEFFFQKASELQGEDENAFNGESKTYHI